MARTKPFPVAPSDQPSGDPAELLNQIVDAKTAPPHVAELAVGMIRAFGGVDGFCRELMRVYEDAKVSEQRAILTTLLKLYESTTLMGASEEQFDVMNPEDVRIRLQKELGIG